MTIMVHDDFPLWHSRSRPLPPAGEARIRAFLPHCDVFVENFKVGDMARYGLDYASRLVYCSVTGFGQTGPYRERAGYDYAIQGMGGLMSVSGIDMALLDTQVSMLANL